MRSVWEAVLGLIGVLITAVVAWLGVLAATRSERRLVVESAIKAAEQLATKDGNEPKRSTIAAALISLADLGQAELATSMLWDLWVGHSASNETAILVINKAIDSRGESASRLAAELLWHRAPTLDSTKASNWPDCVDGRWIPKLGPLTKLLLIDAMLRMTYQHDPDQYTIPATTVRLYCIAKADKDPNIGGLARALLFMLTDALSGLQRTHVIHADKVVKIADISRLALDPKKLTGGIAPQLIDRTDELKRWTERKPDGDATDHMAS